MPDYPLIGPHVQSIFEYIKFEKEDIHLGSFIFDYLTYFGLPPGFNYDIDFFSIPAFEEGINPASYGIISTCDAACALNTVEAEYIYNFGVTIAGPAIRIVSGDKTNATLYAALYNARDHILVLVRYLNQSVISYGKKLGVIFDVNLVAGDRVKLTGTDNDYSVSINGALAIGPIHNTDISDANVCVGAIELSLDNTPVLKHLADTFDDTYASRVFYYCDDGIAVASPLSPINDSDNHFIFDAGAIVKSGQNGDKCYGFAYAQGFTNVDLSGAAGRGHYIEFVTRYFTTVSGSPISGPAFLIDESKADPDDFTGWVVLVNKDLGKLQLGYYLNQSLGDLPTIVASANKDIANGTLVKVIASFGDDVADTAWSINVYTRQPSDITFINDITYTGANQLPNGDQIAVRMTRTNYGLAWVGNSALGNHAAYWSGTITQQYALIM